MKRMYVPGLFRIETLHATELEAQAEEGVLVLHDGGADLQVALQIRCPDLGIFLHEGAEQADDGQADAASRRAPTRTRSAPCLHSC